MIVITGLILVLLLGSLYNRHVDNKINANLKLVLATIYNVDNDVKYRHHRVSFFFSIKPGRQDSSHTFRDDLSSDCFWNLKGKQIGLALDSLNPLRNGHLLVTKEDFEKFAIPTEYSTRLNIFPQCD